ncbi:MAG: hypothetical protein QG608_171 [Actinomycetota bacterium]|nr:hypothetical protein [Actinomycetota bacterium]
MEEICERAGFTRGAFYSNFSNKDDLLLALYDHQSVQLMAVLDEVVSLHVESAKDPAARRLSVEEVAAAVLRAIPQDRRWFLVNSEFILYAVRNPTVAAALVAERAKVRSGLADLLRDSFSQLGLDSEVDLEQVVRWLFALHEGGLNQSYLEPDVVEPGAVALAAAPRILAALTVPVPAASSGTRGTGRSRTPCPGDPARACPG